MLSSDARSESRSHQFSFPKQDSMSLKELELEISIAEEIVSTSKKSISHVLENIKAQYRELQYYVSLLIKQYLDK